MDQTDRPIAAPAAAVIQHYSPQQSYTPTETEAAFFSKVGWQPGMPVPDLADEIDKMVGQPTDTGALDLGRILDFDSLPEEHKARLKSAVNSTVQQAAHLEAQQAVRIQDAGPGVNDAIMAAMQAADSVEVVMPTKAARTAEPATKPAEEPANAEPVTAAPEICHHCGWNLAFHPEDNITEEDMRSFFVCVMSGGRFEKVYKFFNDTVIITYRSLTTPEADAALEQVAYDGRDGHVPDRGEYYRRNMNYRLAMGVKSIAISGQAIRVIPTLEEWVKERNPALGTGTDRQTALKAYAEWFKQEVLTSESIRRILGLNFQRFTRYIENLEARVDSPDFWKGIGS